MELSKRDIKWAPDGRITCILQFSAVHERDDSVHQKLAQYQRSTRRELYMKAENTGCGTPRLRFMVNDTLSLHGEQFVRYIKISNVLLRLPYVPVVGY